MCCVQAGQALTYDELQGLTYLQVKGSGIANTCPVLEQGSSDPKDLKPGNYKIEKLCLEPTSFTVKEESQFKDKEAEFVKTKLMTRLTYTLDEVSLRLLPGSCSQVLLGHSILRQPTCYIGPSRCLGTTMPRTPVVLFRHLSLRGLFGWWALQLGL